LRKAEGGKQKARNPQVSRSLAVRFLLFAFRWNDLKTGSEGQSDSEVAACAMLLNIVSLGEISANFRNLEKLRVVSLRLVSVMEMDQS